ncbi:MAG TPA: type VI secretion IcmF C-terminal domain-containing protein, partial [Telluria sp.]
KPTEAEIDKVWAAQVLQPFRQNLVGKYPFSSDSRSEATNEEIGLVFGPSGVVAKFFDTTIGPLVVRRGDVVAARTWANMGIGLSPSAVSSFPSWIAPLSAGGVANAAVASTSTEAQTQFDLQALGATGATEFTIEIDGQSLRWKGQPQPYVRMVWPNPQGTPGSRITAITPAGQTVVLLNEPGHFGLRKMVESAQRKRKDDGAFELSWETGGVKVTSNLKIIPAGSAPRQAPAAAPSPGKGFKGLRLPDTIISSTLPAAAPAPAAAAAGARP